MPNRIIRERARTSKTLDKLSDGAERLFWRLTTVADDFGRFDADPRLLLASCFPLRTESLKTSKVAEWYAELEKELVVSYRDGDRTLGYFVTWEKWQTRRAKASKFPSPTSASTCSQMRADVPVFEERGTRNVFEERGTRNSSEPSADAETPEPVVSGFPTNGTVKSWDLRADLVESLADAYPGIDIVMEARKAKVWCVSNPTKRKTARGMPKFLNAWMERQQNGATSNGTRPPPTRTETSAEYNRRSLETALRRKGLGNGSDTEGHRGPLRPDLEIRDELPGDQVGT